MMGYENVDAFQSEYALSVINSDGICVWRHSARYLDCMKDDSKYLETFADKDYTIEIEEPDEPKKILELTSQTLSGGLFVSITHHLKVKGL